MTRRNFAGRGPTLAELNKATRAARARKAAATAQALGKTTNVNTANTAAANAVTQASPAVKQTTPQKSVIGTDARGKQITVAAQQPSSNSLKAAQQIQQQSQTTKTVPTASKTNIAQKSGNFVNPGRQVRSGPVSGPHAVQGKRLSEFAAEDAAARATALSNAAVNNTLVGGDTGRTSGGSSSYYDVDAALADVYKQAQATGITLSRPSSYGKTVTDGAKAQAIIDAYAKRANDELSKRNGSSKASSGSGQYYDVDSSLNSVYNQARDAGVSIAKPQTYGKSITDAAKAQSIIDNYVKTANNAIAAQSKTATKAAEPVYDVTEQYNDIDNQAKGYGVNVAKPAQTQFKTQAAAQAALDDYVSRVNTELENRPAPTYENIDPQKTAGYGYVYSLSHAQQNELIRRNQTRKQQGKPELSEYEFRKEKGVPVTTQAGSYTKPKLTNKSISTAAGNGNGVKAVKDGGLNGRQEARTGSGDVKIANIKAASKGISPDNKKVTVISATEAKKKQEAQVAAKKDAASQATVQATKADKIAVQAKQEATAKQKAANSVKAAANKSVSAPEKAKLKQEAKTLQKEADKAKDRQKKAESNATATKELAKATAKAASAPIGSKSSANAVKAVSKAAAKADKTSVAASKAGVTDHTGQILLKDGSWINRVQRTGGKGTGEGRVKSYTPSELEDVVKSNAKALEDAKKASEAYLAAHSTLNNIEIAGGRNVTERNVRVIGAKDKNDLQYVQTASSVYDLQRTAKQKITSAMLRRANEGSKVDAGKISAIEGARTWLSDNKIAMDAKTVANTPITSETTAAESKLINKARDKVTAKMKFTEKTKYLTGLRSIDYEAEKANTAYHAAVKAADGKYRIADEEAFKKEIAAVNKATKGMTEAQRKQYLINRASKDVASPGRLSDLDEFINTDLVEAAGITGSVMGSIRYRLGDKTAKPLTFGQHNKRVSKSALTQTRSYVSKNTENTVDVIDNISRKQLVGEQLTATETALLTQISGGYKTGSTAKVLSGKVDSATAWTQGKVQGIRKNYKVGDRFIGVPLTTNLVEWANELQTGAINAIGVVGGTISSVPKVTGYGWSQVKGVNSVNTAMTAGSNIALSGALVASTMGRGMKQQYETDKSQFIIDMALAQAAFSGAGKAVYKPVRYAAKKTALKTGITRAQALGSDLIPYKEAGSILDEIRYNKKITGVHASNIRDKVGKDVYTSAPGHTIYIEPGTYGAKGRFATVSNEFADPYGKYFAEKSVKTFRNTRERIGKVTSPVSNYVTSKLPKISKTTRYIDDDGVVKYKKTYTSPTTQRVYSTASRAKSTVGKVVGNRYVSGELPAIRRALKERSPRTREKVVDRMTGDTVKLSKAQWDRIYTKFSRDGNFWDEYKSITGTAQKQANKLQRPVVVPSPKVAKGIMEAENEVFWIFPENSLKITSRQRIGKTANGVDVYDVRYGKQAAVTQKSLSQRLKENRVYNKQMVKAVDGKKYNLNYIKSYAEDANRRLGELYGNKTTRPNAYEQGAHGKAHTEQVGRNVSGQKVTDSTEMDYWLGVMHDVTKIGPHESAGIPHAVAAAEVIKRGMITDARFNKFYNGLSKARQTAFVKAIGEHTTIKPINRHLVTEWDFHIKRVPKLDKNGKVVTKNGKIMYKRDFGSDWKLGRSVKERAGIVKEGIKTKIIDRPSTMSKALATADRLDFIRFKTSPKKRMMFNDLKRKSGASVTSRTSETVRSKLAKMSERKSATFASRAKIYEQRTRSRSTAAKKTTETQKKSRYEYKVSKKPSRAGLYAAAGYSTSYKEFASSLDMMYKYTTHGAKSATYGYTKSDTKSGAYGYAGTGAKSKAYPAAYKRSEYKKGVNGYGKTSGESYKKAAEYVPPKEYAVTKGEYYKPTSGYNRPYAGKYNPKPSAYITPYTGKYTPKPSGYGNAYPGKYNPAPGGYGGNYGGNGGYAGGNYGNYGIAVIVDKSPLIPKKKKTHDQISRKRVKDDVKLTRDIKNRLGSLDSMFGSSRSQSKPKSRTVTSAKKATTKKTVKRTKRA